MKPFGITPTEAFSVMPRYAAPEPSVYVEWDTKKKKPLRGNSSVPRDQGVYIAFDRCGACLYVGESLNLRARICGTGRPEFEFCDWIALVLCRGDERMRCEKYYQGLLFPMRNKELKCRSTRISDTNVGLYKSILRSIDR